MDNFWDYAADRLATWGISHVFGMVGDGYGLLEAAQKHRTLRAVPSCDQRGAVAMAIGYAQATQHLAVLACSSGPGLCNATIGLLEAFSGQIPLLVLANGTHRALRDRGAFQENNAVHMLQPMTKWAYRVETAAQLARSLDRAHHLAGQAPQQPVYLEVPNDLQTICPKSDTQLKQQAMNIATTTTTPYQAPNLLNPTVPPTADCQYIADRLTAAKKPVILAGGGAKRAQAGDLICALAHKTQAAIFITASARGLLDETDPLFCGLMGLYLTPPSTSLLQEADFIFIIGSQLEETVQLRTKGSLVYDKCLQLDNDPAVLGKNVAVKHAVVGEAHATLSKIVVQLADQPNKGHWLARIKAVKAQIATYRQDIDFKHQPVRFVYRALDEVYQTPAIAVLDNGMDDMWGYYYPVFISRAHHNCLTPAEQTGLGLSVGSALGAKLAEPDKDVVAIVGDGALLHGFSALYARHGLGVVLIVIDNGGFGWPRIAQQKAGVAVGCRFTATDLPQLVRSIGGVCWQLATADEVIPTLQAARMAAREGNLAVIFVPMVWGQDMTPGLREDG